MKTLLRLLGLLALALVITPPCVAFHDGVGLTPAMKTLMVLGTLLWFATATPLVVTRDSAPAGNVPKPESR